MTTPPEVDILAMIDEVKRELAMRGQVFPRLAREGRMNRHTADRRIRVMAAVLANLEAQRDASDDNRQGAISFDGGMIS